jgi:hypothetical protein
MNLKIDDVQLFAKIGVKQLIIEALEAKVAELQAEIEKLKPSDKPVEEVDA